MDFMKKIRKFTAQNFLEGCVAFIGMNMPLDTDKIFLTAVTIKEERYSKHTRYGKLGFEEVSFCRMVT
ncbi:hypothetical protein TorRG33x02_333880 [Trema orientale]|uniref:Uncharacterized protein n=1 Tax=Trema orientale TaxID=63057 RepID=A0A2P5B3J0_TREOI|nr:hypothetical protein TorRG33x02_333880 [Trema orientale]